MSNQKDTFSLRLTCQKDTGTYEILCMTAGTANGWVIEPAALKASVPLWEKVHSFIDHDLLGRSVRDLCGMITNPTWNEDAQGIQAVFTPFGPAADVAKLVAQDVTEKPELAGNIGFSADVYFTATGDHIDQFTRVNSVDLVINPARGGRWLRAINSLQEKNMTPQDNLTDAEKELARLQAQKAELDAASARQAELDKIKAANEQAERLRIQMCASVLASTLAASNLPAAMQERIREDFKDRTFEPADLNTRIENDRKLLSALTAGNAVQGPGRISAMFSTDDQLRAAVDDLLGAERDPELANLKVHKLSGIRELYHMLTGDFDLHGGFYPDRATFQLTTANFPVLVKNAMNKVLVQAWNEFGKAGYNWWEQIVTVEHFTTLQQITWAIFGTIGSLPEVSEGGEYTPLKIGDGGETTDWDKHGGYLGITLEAIDRDETRRFKQAPRELAFAAIRNISEKVAALFTVNSGAGPTLADGGALFNATAVTTAGGHANLLTTALGTDYTAWEAVAAAMYNQPMLVANETGYYGTGKKMAVDPKFILIPRALRGAANNLFLSRSIPGVSVPLSSGKEWYGMVIPLTVPEWTDANDWAAVADPKLVPGIMLGERFGVKPEIFIAGNETDPAMFMNDEARIKVRQFIAVGVCDFRPLHKSNVA